MAWQKAEGEKLRGDAFALAAAANEASAANDPQLSALLAHAAGEKALDLPEESDLQMTVAEAMLNSLINGSVSDVALEGHQGTVYSVDYAPDGTRVASAGSDETVKVWDVASGVELLTLIGHEDDVASVKFSPDGSRILSGSLDTTARLWDAETGELLQTFTGAHSQTIVGVAFSPDQTRLATASSDETAAIWDIETGEILSKLDGHVDRLQSVVFSADGAQLATASIDGTAKIWDAETGAESVELSGMHTDGVTHVTYSESLGAWFTSSDDGSAVMWDAESGEPLRQYCCHEDDNGNTLWMDGLAVSPDGTLLATVGQDAAVRLWDIESGEEVDTYNQHTDHTWEVAFHPDQNQLASASSDGTVILHTLGERSIFDQRFVHDGEAVHFVMSGDESTLATYSEEEKVATIFAHRR